MHEAGCRTILQSRHVTVGVSSPTDGDAAWLAEFLGPAFRQGNHAADAHYDVDAIVDAHRFDALLAGKPDGVLSGAVAFVLDQRTLTTSSWRDPRSGLPVFFDAAHHTIYLRQTGSPGVTVVARTGGRLFRGAVMRIVREVAMTRAWTANSLVLHASAFATEQGAVVVAGPKRAGKTSLLLHALHAPGVSFIANDRVVLAGDGHGFSADGMPSIASLRHSTLAIFPGLSDTLATRGYRAHLTCAECEGSVAARGESDGSTSPAQLCRAVGVPMSASAPATAILLPHVDLSSPGFDIRPLSRTEADARFEAVRFASASRGRTSEIFRTDGTDVIVDLSQARAVWSHATASVPVFECRIGRGAFDRTPESTVLAIVPPPAAWRGRRRDARRSGAGRGGAADGPARRRCPGPRGAAGRWIHADFRVRRAADISPRVPGDADGWTDHQGAPDAVRNAGRSGLRRARRPRRVSAFPRVRTSGRRAPRGMGGRHASDRRGDSRRSPARGRDIARADPRRRGSRRSGGRKRREYKRRRTDTEAHLKRLTDDCALDLDVVDVLVAALRRLDPGRARIGLVHLDFAFHNFVIDPAGGLRLVDNEAMTVDAFDYDLARSWYRNAVAPETWAQFENEYRSAGGAGARDESAGFWRIAAVVEGAVTRLDVDPDRADMPLDRLRAMAAELRGHAGGAGCA